MSTQTVLGLKERVLAIKRLGELMSSQLAENDAGLLQVISQAHHLNPWFTDRFVRTAISEWSRALTMTDEWLKPYGNLNPESPLTIGVVNAGNIPLVGLHDMISVLLSGHIYLGKNATGDTVLLPYVASLLKKTVPHFENRIAFTEKLSGMHAVIATGSNNSARYFEYYFGKYPHIIRKNRNGVAVLTGSETDEELHSLGNDIFQYFGLGCRNVSKLYVPKGYDFKKFFEAIFDYSFVNESSKYMNNFEYNNSVLLLKRIPFLQNGFLIIREEKQIASPISVVHYETYESQQELLDQLMKDREQLQCIAAGHSFYEKPHDLKEISVAFGSTQSPELWEYADGVDTIKFLSGLAHVN